MSLLDCNTFDALDRFSFCNLCTVQILHGSDFAQFSEPKLTERPLKVWKLVFNLNLKISMDESDLLNALK